MTDFPSWGSITIKRIIYGFFILSIFFFGCSPVDHLANDNAYGNSIEEQNRMTEDGHYTSKDEVAAYVHTYGKLPPNYITKAEAMELGWEASEGNLWEVAEGKSIGGDRFFNREGKLPEEEGRVYYEADVNYEGGYRGPERIVYSNDGLVYYTPDHYETFTLLYGDE